MKLTHSKHAMHNLTSEQNFNLTQKIVSPNWLFVFLFRIQQSCTLLILHNKKINKHRREDYDADVDKKQQFLDRANRSYQIQLIVKQDLIDLALNEEPGDDAKITKFFSQFSSLTKRSQWRIYKIENKMTIFFLNWTFS